MNTRVRSQAIHSIEVLLYIIKYIFKVIFPDTHHENIDCLTFDGSVGKCKSFFDCNSFSPKTDLKLLRKSLCGFNEEIPLICCPTKHFMQNNKSDNNSKTMKMEIIVKDDNFPECKA